MLNRNAKKVLNHVENYYESSAVGFELLIHLQ